MKELKVLFILENVWMHRAGKLKVPVYNTDTINIKNATYARFVPYFKNSAFTLYFGETTPYISNNNKQKFTVDLKWLKQTVEYDEWFAVITLCKKAEDGLKKLGYEPFMNLPHPASWKWRKQMILDCVTKLNLKLETMKNM
jgi:hypothetical protein